jgi:CO/xanthine dehydrogenase Mo-binding subunit
MFDQVKTEDLSYVGQKAGRPDMVEKLTGEATFVSDMVLPGMLHAQLKKSPHARARIKRIDTARAAAMPGVRAIVTGDELDYHIGLYIVDKFILAKGEVRHYGEAVAAVAAETLEQARAAVEAIEVEYETLPPVLHHMDPSCTRTSAATRTWPRHSRPSRAPTSPTTPSSARVTWSRASRHPSSS